MKQDYLFFLGGQDLEMCEIRHILETYGLEEGIHFHDKKLRWGAKISDYQGLYHPKKVNVCIELQEDITPPNTYLRIDHHNELSHLPASIEQVASLLDIQLSREQQLIAANDRGYIPAMRQMGATEEEIQQIRHKDRQAQGVSPEEEQQAILDLQSHTYVDHLDLVIVHTSLSHFSPITDRLYGRQHILIYNEEELTYYGPNKQQLATHFQAAVKAGKAYHGGQENGFFGFAAGHWTQEQIGDSVELITQLLVE